MDQQTIILKARQWCQQRGVRFTVLREKVYALLLAHERPLGAYALLDELRATQQSARPATVYRALDFLLSMGMIHRLETSNAFVACVDFDTEHTAQFLICETCGNVREMRSDGLRKNLHALAQGAGFAIRRQTVEARGICASCQIKTDTCDSCRT